MRYHEHEAPAHAQTEPQREAPMTIEEPQDNKLYEAVAGALYDDGVRDGTLSFSFTSIGASGFELRTVAECLTNFEKLLTAIGREVTGLKKNRTSWKVIDCTLTKDDKGEQTFLVRVKGYFSMAAQCEQRFVDLHSMLTAAAQKKDTLP